MLDVRYVVYHFNLLNAKLSYRKDFIPNHRAAESARTFPGGAY